MFPNADHIRIAAYHRWERRGFAHGCDFDDWMAAEQDMLFALNYDLIAHYKLDAPQPVHLGEREPRVCRFCEGSAPRVDFAESTRPIPQALGNHAVQSLDECEECHLRFTEEVLTDFERFALPYATGKAQPGRGASPPISVGAFKGLTKMALSVMPEPELEFFPDTLEWVANPDHDADRATFAGRGLGCYVHQAGPFKAPFAALARRREDDAPMPYMLFFLGTSGLVFEAPLPLCVRDEDQEAGATLVPRVSIPCGSPPFGAIDSACSFLPLATGEPARKVAASTR
jgi:hypothetical protein